MNKTINILFLGGAKRVSLAEHFIKAGNLKNLNIKIFSYELSEKVPISSIAKVIIGLKWSDVNLLSHLKSIIEENNIKIVLPFVDPAVESAARLKELKLDIYIPVSEVNLCRTMFDKKLSAKWFGEKSIPVPETYTLNTIKYPSIFKPVKGSASKGLIIVNKPEELKNIEEPENYLVQQYISNSEEYTVDCFVSADSELIAVVPRIRLETAGGEVVRSVTVRDNNIIDISKKILRSGNFYGPVTIQFIKDLDKNTIFVMEINPRLGGGVILSIEAGAGIPGMILDESLGYSILPCNNWKENTLMTRYFKEVIFYADNN